MKFEDLPADIQLVAANCLSRLIMDRSHMEKEPMERLARDVKNAFIELFGSESESIDHTKSTQVVCRVKDKGGSLEVCSDGISRFHSIALWPSYSNSSASIPR
ncbi:hypothetical protein QU814_04610 [Providencia rettgeri]|nr:hypothetical protein [Providencia rettgeri]MDM9282474.1 hypothetical protein [Providencia rettgeri]